MLKRAKTTKTLVYAWHIIPPFITRCRPSDKKHRSLTIPSDTASGTLSIEKLRYSSWTKLLRQW